MEDRDILIDALCEDGGEPSEAQIARLDADLTKLAHILFDYFIEQKRRGKKISDPYLDDESSNERSHLLPRINKRTSGRHKSDDTASSVHAIRGDKQN